MLLLPVHIIYSRNVFLFFHHFLEERTEFKIMIRHKDKPKKNRQDVGQKMAASLKKNEHIQMY